jgi:hypothetical protein
MTYTCPVCGFDGLDESPYSPAGHGLYEICPCCGFQFGVTDDAQGISFHEWRNSWIEKGMNWDSKGRPTLLSVGIPKSNFAI